MAELEAEERGRRGSQDIADFVPFGEEALAFLGQLREERDPRGPVTLSLLSLWELWEKEGLPSSSRSRLRADTEGRVGVAYLDRPSPDELFECVRRNQPAVIRGCLDEQGFPPLRDFADFSYLRARCGHRRVQLKADRLLDRSGRRYFVDDPTEDATLSDFLALLEDAERRQASPTRYLGKSNLCRVAPELADDIAAAPRAPLAQFATCFGPNTQGVHTYLGCGFNTTPIHCDSGENLLAVLAGTKRFDLYPPTDADCLYIVQKINSSVPPFVAPEAMPEDLAERCPLYRQATPIRVDLEKGDMLYLPVFWWHGVTGGAERNMLVNWWCEMHPRKAEVTAASRGARGVMGDLRRLLAS